LPENPFLDEFHVQNLNPNRTCRSAGEFDGGGDLRSVQYLTQPVDVLSRGRARAASSAPVVITFPTAASTPRRSPAGDARRRRAISA